MSKTVSVVIACYNQQNNIKKCLDAILKNKKQPIEIIVVNDASTDNTLEIINDLEIKIVKVLSNKINRGIGYSRTKGIEIAKGEVIAICDANSFVDERWIYEISKSINDYSTCVYGKVIPPNITSFTNSILISESISSGIINKYFGNDAIPGHNFAISKKCLKDIGGYGSLPGWGSDALLYSKLKEHSMNIIYNNKMLVQKDYETGYYNLFQRRFRWGRGSRLSHKKKSNKVILLRRFLVLSFFSVLSLLVLNDILFKHNFLPPNSSLVFIISCMSFTWIVGFFFNVIKNKSFALTEIIHLPFIYATKGIATSTGYYYQFFKDIK